jgi:hypothetical protein
MDENTKDDKIKIFIAYSIIIIVTVMVLLVAFGAFDTPK